MFYKDVNCNSRETMLDFIRSHERYYTMDSCNGIRSIANNVKIYNLELPEDVSDKAYDVCYSNYNEFCDVIIQDFFEDFYSQTGYAIAFNGITFGHLVMYNTEKTKSGYNMLVTECFNPDTMKDQSNEDIAEAVRIIQQFDKTCDDIREAFIDFLRRCTIKSKTIYKPETVTSVFISSEDT